MSYTLTVDIDSTQQKILKDAGYQLCIAKLVNGVYNVVFLGQQFLASNTFQWTEQYQVFATQNFTDGLLVKAATNAVDIACGQTATLDKEGVFEAATGPDGGNTFTAVNNYAPIHFGVNLLNNGTYLPIYVDENNTVVGDDTLQPVVKVLVWFDRTLKTGTMFSHSVSLSFEVDLTSRNDATISYVTVSSGGAGAWQDGPDLVLPSTYSSKTGFTPLNRLPSGLGRGIAAQIDARQAAGEPPSPALLGVTLGFHSASAANDAAAFLSNRGVTNLKLSAPKITSGKTTKVYFQIGWADVVFLRNAMKGNTDIEKIENAFTCELGVLRHGPTEKKFKHLIDAA